MPADNLTREVSCQLRPHPDASAAQLHTLFDCLADWSEREAGVGGLLAWMDHVAAWSLEVGEEPVVIDFALRRHPRPRLIDHLKTAFPVHLVADIVLDGRSWADETE